MITYNKRKNSDKWYLSYLNVIIPVIIIGAFALMSLKVADDMPLQEDSSYALPGDVDVSGEWVGMMTEDYSGEIRYDYRLTLDQNGNILSGISYQESTNFDIEIYAESSLSGDVDGNDIYFYETSTDVLDNLSLDHWCRIEVRLNYQVVEGQETLIGTWDSAEEERPGCITIDGRVVLTRQSD